MKRRFPKYLLFFVLALFSAPVVAVAVSSLDLSGAGLFSHYADLFREPSFLRALSRSLLLSVPAAILHLPFAIGAGLYLARGRGVFRSVLLIACVILLIMPFQVIMLPVYQGARAVGLYDTLIGPILLAVFFPIGALLMMTEINGIEENQWEAAELETSSLLQILIRVVLPQILPGIALMCLLIFTESWNMVEQPLLLLERTMMRPLSLYLNDITSHGSDFGYAGCTVYAAPVVLFVLLLRRSFADRLLPRIG